MSVESSRLHLLIPGLLGPMGNPEQAGARPSAPQLERVLARADRECAYGEDYLSTLFFLFGISRGAEADLPEGAVNLHAGGEDASGACWMRADPVHLRPDRDRLLLFAPAHLEVTEAEAEAVAREFNAHFAPQGLQLVTPEPARWYVKLAACPALRTQPLSRVVGHHIEPYMPEGKEAGRWRSLLNEMQMLLFQSPVNQRREAQGGLSLNGIWLSGIGRLPEVKACGFARVYGDDPSPLGLARLAGLRGEASAAAAWNEGQETLAVFTDLVSPVLNADPYAWAEAVNLVDLKLGRLLSGLGRSKRGECIIYPCNGECYVSTPGTLRRFWRRTRKLSALLGRAHEI